MNTWNVTLQCENKTIEITVIANTYSDAYIKAEEAQPGCRIVNIKLSQIENKKLF